MVAKPTQKPKKSSVKKRPTAKRLPHRLPRKGVAAKGQKAALEALFKTYPINGNDDDDED